MQILNKQQMYSLGSIFLPKHYTFYLILLLHSVMLQQKFKIVSHVFHRSLLSSLMRGFWNSSYPENLELSPEQETVAF